MTSITDKYLKNLKTIHESKSSENVIKLTETQAENLIGRDYKTWAKTLETAIKQNADKLTDKKMSFKIQNIYLVLGDGPSHVSIHGQGIFVGGGALNMAADIPIKVGNPKFGKVETVGRI